MAHHPSALRNRGLVLEQLQQLPLPDGDALEFASGSGAHIEIYAPALKRKWQPSEVEGVKEIDEFGARLHANVLPAVHLDTGAPFEQWPESVRSNAGRYALAVVSNFTHIVPWRDTLGMLAGAAQALAPGGFLAIYGPFLPFPSEGEALKGDQAFDAGLRARNPEWGVRMLTDVAQAAADVGLELTIKQPMPRGNFFIGFRTPL